MSYEDKTLQCADCGADFIFSAGEQEFFASKGFTNVPRRCPACRQNRRADRAGSGGRRKMYDAVCAQCGVETQVPFEPRDGRPVYCSDCFGKMRQ